MFNVNNTLYMKSTNKTKERTTQNSINFRALFTGEVMATPVMFNPTADDLRRLKNIPEQFDVNEPEYNRVIKDKDYHTVSLLCKFNPNEALKLKTPKYSDEVFVEYKIFVSNRPVVGNASGKTQVIDCHNQNGWLLIDEKGGSIEEQMKLAQADDSPYKDGDPIRKMNPSTTRVAKQGEVALYDLVFKMSTLDKHYINQDDDSKSTRLEDFRLGENPTEIIDNIFNGDYTALNMLIANNDTDFEGKDFFVNRDGENNKIGLFLGVRPSVSGDKIYQDVLAPFTVGAVGFEAVTRPSDRLNDYTDVYHNKVKLGRSRLNKKALEALIDEKYGWSCFWNNSFEFQEVTIDDLPNENTDVTGPVQAPVVDDLPF